MKTLNRYPPIFLISLVGMALLFSQQSAHAIRNMEIGDAMPEFTLPLVQDPSGALKNTALIGKPSVIIFWRPGQELSLDALRELDRVIQKVGAKKVNVAAVDVSRSSNEDIQSVFAEEPLSYSVLLDPERALYGEVGVIVAPTTLMFDEKGILQFIAPSFPNQYGRVAEARFRFLLGEIDEAKMNELIEPALLKIEHGQALAWRKYKLGKHLEETGKIEQALASYEESIGAFPQLVEAQCALGFLNLLKGETMLAATSFQAALRHQPNFSMARLGKAIVLARLNQLDEAEKRLLELQDEASVSVRVQYELGKLYRARGELDRAVEAYEKALTLLYPESTP